MLLDAEIQDGRRVLAALRSSLLGLLLYWYDQIETVLVQEWIAVQYLSGWVAC